MKQDLDMETAAVILKLLGDRTRLAIVKILEQHDCCVCEFVALFNMSQPAISQHLRKLRDSGIVKETRRGQWIFYSLNSSYPNLSFIKSVICELPSQQFRIDELESQGKRIACE